ncbi:hypothetical protein QTN25_001383 [Entamoeba marina]
MYWCFFALLFLSCFSQTTYVKFNAHEDFEVHYYPVDVCVIDVIDGESQYVKFTVSESIITKTSYTDNCVTEDSTTDVSSNEAYSSTVIEEVGLLFYRTSELSNCATIPTQSALIYYLTNCTQYDETTYVLISEVEGLLQYTLYDDVSCESSTGTTTIGTCGCTYSDSINEYLECGEITSQQYLKINDDITSNLNDFNSPSMYHLVELDVCYKTSSGHLKYSQIADNAVEKLTYDSTGCSSDSLSSTYYTIEDNSESGYYATFVSTTNFETESSSYVAKSYVDETDTCDSNTLNTYYNQYYEDGCVIDSSDSYNYFIEEGQLKKNIFSSTTSCSGDPTSTTSITYCFTCTNNEYFRCDCPSTENKVKGENDVCECDSENGFISNSSNSDFLECVCDIENHYILTNGLCQCDSSNHFVANGLTCECSSDYSLDESTNECVYSCGVGEVVNSNNDGCECDTTNGFSEGTSGCECDTTNHYAEENGVCVCDSSKNFVEGVDGCECKSGFEYNSSTDICFSECGENQIIENGVCVCDEENGYSDVDGSCVFTCYGIGEIVNESNDGCICDSTLHFNRIGNTCDCTDEYELEDETCIWSCDTGYVANSNNDGCVCDTDNGYATEGDECVFQCTEEQLSNHCTSCSDSSTCSTCANGYDISTSNTCIQCGDGYRYSEGECVEVAEEDNAKKLWFEHRSIGISSTISSSSVVTKRSAVSTLKKELIVFLLQHYCYHLHQKLRLEYDNDATQ